MPPTAAIFSVVGLFLTNPVYRRAPFWAPVLVAAAIGLTIARALLFWWKG